MYKIRQTPYKMIEFNAFTLFQGNPQSSDQESDFCCQIPLYLKVIFSWMSKKRFRQPITFQHYPNINILCLLQFTVWQSKNLSFAMFCAWMNIIWFYWFPLPWLTFEELLFSRKVPFSRVIWKSDRKMQRS